MSAATLELEHQPNIFIRSLEPDDRDRYMPQIEALAADIPGLLQRAKLVSEPRGLYSTDIGFFKVFFRVSGGAVRVIALISKYLNLF